MKFLAFQNPALFETLNKIFSATLPVKVAYRLSKLQKLIGTEAEKYNELRMQVINRYGEKNEAGELVADSSGNVKILDADMPALIKEMTDLHDIEIDLNTKVKISELDSIELTTYDLTMLEALDILEE